MAFKNSIHVKSLMHYLRRVIPQLVILISLLGALSGSTLVAQNQVFTGHATAAAGDTTLNVDVNVTTPTAVSTVTRNGTALIEGQDYIITGLSDTNDNFIIFFLIALDKDDEITVIGETSGASGPYTSVCTWV